MSHVEKVLCENENCEKWLARVEAGILYIRCARCGKYREVELTEFLRYLEEWLAELRGLLNADLKLPIPVAPVSSVSPGDDSAQPNLKVFG